MEIKFNPSWQSILNEEINKPYFTDLMNSVEEEYSINTCYPPKELIFSAFDYVSFENLKVVIIGQDPYHGEGEANGLCFSVNDSVKIPPSLKNIFKETKINSFDSIKLNTAYFDITEKSTRSKVQDSCFNCKNLSFKEEKFPNSICFWGFNKVL